MWLWLHVNYRQFFHSQRGWGGGSVSMYTTHMNGANLAKKLSPNIFLLFPRETGEEGRSRVTGTSKTHTLTHTLAHAHTECIQYFELKNRFNYSLKDQIMLAFYFFMALLACSCCTDNRLILSRLQPRDFFLSSRCFDPDLNTTSDRKLVMLIMIFQQRQQQLKLRARLYEETLRSANSEGGNQTEPETLACMFPTVFHVRCCL